MPLYMTQWSYTAEATAAMAKNPQDRSVNTQQLIEKLGGTQIGCYFCFGDYDGLAICEMPDGVTMLAGAMAASAPGHLNVIRTTRLFTMDEAVEAMKRAGTLAYAGPGG